MKVRLLVVALVAVALGISSAIAAPPPGKGKPEKAGKLETAGKPSATSPTCRPKVAVVLKGTLTSMATGLSTGSLSIDVKRANRWGRAYVTAGTATVTVDDETKVRKQGKKMFTDLAVGDRLLVQARACKAELLGKGAPATLRAVRIVAHPVSS